MNNKLSSNLHLTFFLCCTHSYAVHTFSSSGSVSQCWQQPVHNLNRSEPVASALTCARSGQLVWTKTKHVPSYSTHATSYITSHHSLARRFGGLMSECCPPWKYLCHFR